MKKIIIAILCVLIFTGCSAQKLKTEKIKDIEFTVVPQKDIPEEMRKQIDEREKTPFKYTYAEEGQLYIAVGYGEQEMSGYSIEVKELHETENAIYIHTNLIGPSKEEKIVRRKTNPYVVIKMEYMDKKVVFE